MDDDGPRQIFRHQRYIPYPPFPFFFAYFPIQDRAQSKGLISLRFPARLPSMRVLR